MAVSVTSGTLLVIDVNNFIEVLMYRFYIMYIYYVSRYIPTLFPVLYLASEPIPNFSLQLLRKIGRLIILYHCDIIEL